MVRPKWFVLTKLCPSKSRQEPPRIHRGSQPNSRPQPLVDFLPSPTLVRFTSPKKPEAFWTKPPPLTHRSLLHPLHGGGLGGLSRTASQEIRPAGAGTSERAAQDAEEVGAATPKPEGMGPGRGDRGGCEPRVRGFGCRRFSIFHAFNPLSFRSGRSKPRSRGRFRTRCRAFGRCRSDIMVADEVFVRP